MKPPRTSEEARERGRKGGIASGEARRRKKGMKDMAKTLMEMDVVGETNRNNLTKFGVKEEDQNYTTAIVVRLMQKALIDGDTHAIRLLGELTGELSNAVNLDENVIDMEYPPLCIPDNGRDNKKIYAIAPQAGPQTMFMASKADIVVYGGAAGGGKTFALLLESLRHKDVKNFGGVIFRKNYNQISAEGGLWDASHKIFDMVPGTTPGKTPKLHWKYPSGGRLNFAHISCDEDLSSWQGTEICYLGFDELTHFSKKQFLYMLSRNRSTCGIRPYVRATCNPDADSWVANFISWWINQDTGYPIPERSGIVRYMVIRNDEFYFADTPEELESEFDVKPEECKTVTFIASRLEDNKILMETDPGYLANLKSMLEVERERLLMGNWKIKPAAGMYFKRTQVSIIEEIPNDVIAWARGWDLAATSEKEHEDGDPAFTAGVLIGLRRNGRFVVANVVNQRLGTATGEVRDLIRMTVAMDYGKHGRVVERLPQDPGQAGKEQAQSYIKMLAGYVVKTIGESGSKESRAEPFAMQWQHGNVDVVFGEWNEMYFTQLESFPESKFKDMVDASSSAFNELTIGMAAKGELLYPQIEESVRLDDGKFTILKKDVKQVLQSKKVLSIDVGVEYGGNNNDHAIVASATTGGYDSLIVLKSETVNSATEQNVLFDSIVQFVLCIIREYGYVTRINVGKASILTKGLKKSLVEHSLGNIRISSAGSVSENECIDATASLITQGRLFFTEECTTLHAAMSQASWNPNRQDRVRLDGDFTDNKTLRAFEYTFEKDIQRLTRIRRNS